MSLSPRRGCVRGWAFRAVWPVMGCVSVVVGPASATSKVVHRSSSLTKCEREPCWSVLPHLHLDRVPSRHPRPGVGGAAESFNPQLNP
eukprot:3832226-Prymnesium_polylepis.2